MGMAGSIFRPFPQNGKKRKEDKMCSLLRKADRKELLLCLVFAAALVVLAVIPTGFEKQIYLNSEGVRATVLETDNSGVYNTGLIKQGDQRCTIRIESGGHKGEVVTAMNLYTGKIEFDKVFHPGESAWVLLERNAEGKITFANMVDHYRISSELLLIGVFALLLILFSGFTGIRTLLSFSFALLSIWKVLIPLTLKGYPPLAVALLVGNAIAVTTLLLVAASGGPDQKSLCRHCRNGYLLPVHLSAGRDIWPYLQHTRRGHAMVGIPIVRRI